jgi:hypothetical protein
MKEIKEIIELALDRLDAFFRYILPGIVVLSAVHISHPSWISFFVKDDNQRLLSLGVLSLVVGAFAYSFHRFSLHQLLDYLSSTCMNNWGKKYRDALKKALEKGVPKDKVDKHISVRSSQLIFLFIFIESFGIFSMLSPEQNSILANNPDVRWMLGVVTVVALPFAIWQYTLVNQLDRTLDRS